MKNDIANSYRNAEGRRVPPFATIWQAAERRHAANRQSYRRLAVAAAVVAAVVVGVNLSTPQSEQDPFVEIADLMESTSWLAPSDVLLPKHEFDIYQDMPMLIESTHPAGGSLL